MKTTLTHMQVQASALNTVCMRKQSSTVHGSHSKTHSHSHYTAGACRIQHTHSLTPRHSSPPPAHWGREASRDEAPGPVAPPDVLHHHSRHPRSRARPSG